MRELLQLIFRKTKFIRALQVALIGIAICGAAALGVENTPKAQAALATSYSYPCSPWGNPYYSFGQYVSGWGYHVGEDVCKGAGIPVYAAADGVVRYSARTPDSYRWGNLIMIEHSNPDGSQVVSLYGHLGDNRAVAAGQTVGRGQLIGYTGPSYSGANGNWGAHLHFGIHAGGYGAATGSYASWAHGYESSFPRGWLHPSAYINARQISYEWSPVSVSGGFIYYNSKSRVTFTVKNTSGETWRKDGNDPNPVRLGTLYPPDHYDPFSDGGTAFGWAAGHRIKLVSDTPNGSNATFTADFVSNKRPGTYHECFGVLREGAKWFSFGAPVCATIIVSPPSWRAEYVGHSYTNNFNATNFANPVSATLMQPGEKRNVKLLLKNAGELPWETDGHGNNPVRLATDRPIDRSSGWATTGNGSIASDENWLGGNRATGIDGRYDSVLKTAVPAEEILPGETAVFSFTVTAPTAPGDYKEYFRPVVEHVMYMPDLGIYFPLSVPEPGFHYKTVSATQPSSFSSSTTARDVTVRLQNTGTASWPVNGNVRLATDAPPDHASAVYTASGSNAWLAANRPSAIDRNYTNSTKTTVDRGEVAEFKFRITVPGWVPSGTHYLNVRPLVEGVTWMPETAGARIKINVYGVGYSHSFQKVTYTGNPAAIQQGGVVIANLAMKNTGRATWTNTGPYPIKLGTFRPNDRHSVFSSLTGSDPWESPNRASGIDGRVTDLSKMTTTADFAIDPGEIAMFRVPLKAPVGGVGNWNEYFSVLAEGLQHLPDLGLYFPLSVIGQIAPPPTSTPTPTPTPTPVAPTPTPTPEPDPDPDPEPTASPTPDPAGGYLPGGLTGKYYQGSFFETLKGIYVDPVIGAGFSYPDFLPVLRSRTQQANAQYASVRWEGKIKIDTAGSYEFCTTSDDGSRTYLNGVRIIDNNWMGNQSLTRVCSAPQTLSVGYHPLMLEYHNYWTDGEGGAGFRLEYRGINPAFTLREVPSDKYYHQ